VGTIITGFHEKLFIMEHIIVGEQHEKLVADGTSFVAYYDYAK